MLGMSKQLRILEFTYCFVDRDDDLSNFKGIIMRSLVAAGIVVFYSSFSVFAQTVSQVQSVSLNAGNTVCASALMSDSSNRNYCWGRYVGRIFLNNSAHSSPTLP